MFVCFSCDYAPHSSLRSSFEQKHKDTVKRRKSAWCRNKLVETHRLSMTLIPVSTIYKLPFSTQINSYFDCVFTPHHSPLPPFLTCPFYSVPPPFLLLVHVVVPSPSFFSLRIVHPIHPIHPFPICFWADRITQRGH